MSRQFGNAIRSGWIAASAAVATLVVIVPAAAEPSSDPMASIDYRDLDLSTQVGVDTLYRRIIAAARRVCPDPSGAGLAVQQVVRDCREAAVAGAVAQIHDAVAHAEQRSRS